YRVTRGFPADERYGLVSQARRAAYSAAANIAEGSAKRGAAECRRYLDIALGSLAELSYAIRLSADLGLLAGKDRATVEDVRKRAGYLTWRLYRSVQRRSKPNP
ncbi:MAG: four helix bundle protein, partial [Anaerolineales bacterium]